MTQAKPYLPGVLGFIAQEVSQAAAIKLAEARGGRGVYVPQEPKADHKLSKIVGLADAKRIAELLGHGSMIVPMGSVAGRDARTAQAIMLLQDGKMSIAEIAAEVDVHERTVKRIKQRLGDADQPDLFS